MTQKTETLSVTTEKKISLPKSVNTPKGKEIIDTANQKIDDNLQVLHTDILKTRTNLQQIIHDTFSTQNVEIQGQYDEKITGVGMNFSRENFYNDGFTYSKSQ